MKLESMAAEADYKRLSGGGVESTTKGPAPDSNRSPQRTKKTAAQTSLRVDESSRERRVLQPFMPYLQTAASQWLERRFSGRRQRLLFFTGLFLTWSLAFAILSDRSIPPINIDGNYQPVKQLTCTDSFWLPDNGCGINGVGCPGAADSGSMAFYCPANCARVKPQTEHLVGPQRVVDQPLVVGGPLYRADSWICPSAVHDGMIDDSKGGCGVVIRTGQTNSYPASSMYGISSLAVRTYFPQSFKFKYESAFECQPKDQTWLLPYISIVFTGVAFLFSTTPLIPFSMAFGVGIFHARFLLTAGNTHNDLLQHAHHGSVLMETLTIFTLKYLPAMVCALLVYKRSVRRIFHNITAPGDKTVFWLGAFWAGLLHSHSIHEHAFVMTASLVLVALHQMRYLQQDGVLSKTYPLYVAFLVVLSASLAIPAAVPARLLVLGLLLLPGSSVQTRLNLVYQGLLVGLLVSGLAQQNGIFPSFSSPLFSSSDVSSSSQLPHGIATPEILEPTIHNVDPLPNITFTWRTPVPAGVSGISMLVNDVERARHLFGDGGDSQGEDKQKFTWTRTPQAVPDYMRFSWVGKGNRLLGYSDAGVWEVDRSWTEIGGKEKEEEQ